MYREFRDVAFEDVVFDDNSKTLINIVTYVKLFIIIVKLKATSIIIKHHIPELLNFAK